MKNPDYWFGIIGPIERAPVNGRECDLRQSCKDAFRRTAGHDAAIVSSGFGVSELRREILVTILARDESELERILRAIGEEIDR